MHEINGTGRSHNPAEASNGARVAISSQGTHGRTNIRPAESEREALTPSTTTPLPNNLAELHRPTPGCTTRRTESYTRNQVYVSFPTPRERFARTSINKPAKCKARADRRRWAARESIDGRCSGDITKACLLPRLLLASSTGTSKRERDRSTTTRSGRNLFANEMPLSSAPLFLYRIGRSSERYKWQFAERL